MKKFATAAIFLLSLSAQAADFSVEYGNMDLQTHVNAHLEQVDLYVPSRRLGVDEIAIDGNVGGTGQNLGDRYQFNFLRFKDPGTSADFMKKFHLPIVAFASQQYQIHRVGKCATVDTYAHYWQAPGTLFRNGMKIFSAGQVAELTASGVISGAKEKSELLESQRLCEGDLLRAGSHDLQILAVPESFGMNLSTAPGASYPTYQAVALVDQDNGEVLISDSLSVLRLQKLIGTAEVTVSAESSSVQCGGHILMPSDAKAATRSDSDVKALEKAKAQCVAIGKTLDPATLRSEVTYYNVCMSAGWATSTSVLKGRCK